MSKKNKKEKDSVEEEVLTAEKEVVSEEIVEERDPFLFYSSCS